MSIAWLPLTEYSSKYRVSISTLRRRIKDEAIQYKFEDGKYFIGDEPISANQKVHRPSQLKSEDGLISMTGEKKTVMERAPFFGLNLDFQEDTHKNQGLQNLDLQKATRVKEDELSSKHLESLFTTDHSLAQEKKFYGSEMKPERSYERQNFSKSPVDFQPITFQPSAVSTASGGLSFSNRTRMNSALAATAAIRNDEPILNEANKLLGELKKAYTLVLQEKEEQILKLRQENADLKTYVKALESENERLQKNKTQNDLWILG